MNRLSSDVGRTVLKNSFSNSANGLPPLSCLTNSSTPGECVGPGSTALTVTAVPAHDSANPRDTANCAVLVMPQWIIPPGVLIELSPVVQTLLPHPRAFVPDEPRRLT